MKVKTKIIPAQRLLPKMSDSFDTVKEQRTYDEDARGRNFSVLMEARSCWDSLKDLRDNRSRCLKYLYGDQWSDDVQLQNGCCITERQQIVEDGNVPLTNNLIRKLVRTVVGVYRNQSKTPGCSANDRNEQKLCDVMNTLCTVNNRNNYKKEVDARCFEDYLAGGAVCQKETWGWNPARQDNDAWTYWPNINRMFWNPDACDPRTWDVTIIGEIHDLSFTDLCGTFAHAPGDVAKLRSIYARCREVEQFRDWYTTWSNQREDYHLLDNLDFFVPYDHRMCRVIEVWRLEGKTRYHVFDPLVGELTKCEVADKQYFDDLNRERVMEYVAQGYTEDDVPKIVLEQFVDEYWYYRFMTPMGDILDEGETPYNHKEHPYALKLYPLVNGEVHSFVGDIIDQQRYVNRMISLNDKLIRSAAKGVLMYPMSLIPDGMTPEDVQREWKNPDAVMFVDDMKGRMSGMKPEQYVNKLVNIGTTEMIQMQMGLLEEISGVNGALQGKPGFSGQSATLYAQQTQNASTAILDLLESFEDLILRGAEKKVSNIDQFYDENRVLRICGDMGITEDELALFGNTRYDLSISEVADTPLARMQANDILMQMFQLGAINIVQLLENGTWPFTDRLLESIKADQQAAQEQQMAAQEQGEMMEQPQMQNTQQALQEQEAATPSGADDRAVQQAQRLMRYPILSPHEAQMQVKAQQMKNAGVY